MLDAATGNWIVYNGEIYNFREIRAELEGDGVRFDSHSDTEALLKAYGRWGEGALCKLRGMFAFAIWDAQRHQLFLARDPMGIKPLYYFLGKGFVSFGSLVQLPAVGGGAQMTAVLVLTEIFAVPLEVATGLGVLLWFISFVAILPLGTLLAFHEGLTWARIREAEGGTLA